MSNLGAVCALRAWRMTEDGRLKSTNFDYVWDGPGPHAAMHWTTSAIKLPVADDHGVRSCTACGFHAYSTLEAAQKSCFTGIGTTIGVILIWGDVASARCEKVDAFRFRASNAMIVALQSEPIPVRVPSEGQEPDYHPSPDAILYPVQRVPLSELGLFAACMFTDTGKSGLGT